MKITQVPQTQSVRPEQDDVTIRYVKDLLAWVEENQLRIDGAEWGSDLPSVESQLGSHRGLHKTVEDFRSKIERARADEVAPSWAEDRAMSDAVLLIFKKVNPRCIFHLLQSQLSPIGKGSYREYMGKLDLQYGKLLVRDVAFQTEQIHLKLKL